MNPKQLFKQYLAQTSEQPIALEISAAKGNYLYDPNGKAYLDLIGGISVCNVGHSNPAVVAAIKAQADKYLHVMVYGELVQSPQTAYAQSIVERLPETLNSVYFTNSGTEATEAAIKLSRRYTQKINFVAAENSYHGHSTGALSLMGSEYWKAAFRPLMPGVKHIAYNSEAFINAIDATTAAVFIEPVQSEAGVIVPHKTWLKDLKKQCEIHNCLLVVDEIQTGFGRTGTLWAFEQLGIVPDMLLLGKALGGGLPMGALVASKKIMDSFSSQPVLGHMTTFGGHPLCCAAGLAALNYLEQEQLYQQVKAKEALFKSLLQHPEIKALRSFGLIIAVELQDETKVLQCLERCLEAGLFSDWFLFAPNCIRIAPPLTITEEEIEKACQILLSSL